MSLFHFPLDRAPSTPVERHHHRASSSRSLTPTSPQSSLSPASASSPGSSCGSSPGGTTRRRARGGRRHRRGGGGGARNAEQRPYHAPTHVSPPHDKPMGKNDMYFALDCEVRRAPPAVAVDEAASTADEVAAEAASTADEVVADAASTADTDGCYCLVFFLFGWAHMLGIRTSRSKTTQWEYAQ